MEQKQNFSNSISLLVSEYEALSQRGEIGVFDERSYLRLIEYYEKEFLLEKALEVSEMAIEQFHSTAELLVKRVEILIELRNIPDALAALEQAEVFTPSDTHLYLLRVKLFCLEEKYDDAQMILEKLKAFVELEDLASVLFTQSYVYECRKQYDLMYDILRKVLLLDPKNEDVHEKFWVCTEISRKFKDSIIFLIQLIDREPYSYMAWYNLGQCYAFIGEYEKGIEAYEYSFIINEKFEQGYRDCAELSFQIGKYKKALKYYIETLQLFGDDSEIYFAAGECCLRLGRFREGRVYFQKSLRLDPYNDEAYFHLGHAFTGEKKWSNAISAYFKAIEIEDRIEEYFSALAKAFIQINQFDKAEYYFRKAIEGEPEEPGVWIEFITFLLNSNRPKEALEILEEAEVITAGAELMYARAACLIAAKKQKQAMVILEEALSESFEEHNVLFTLMPELIKNMDITSIIRYYKNY